jgi:glutathione reductase (NADPH)
MSMSATDQPDFDLFVIGAGSGGVRAARIAAGYGARVAIAEEYRVGGTCVIRGCVPKKLLVYASRFADDFADAAGFGWTLPQTATFDWSALIAAKDKEIDRLEGAYGRTLANAKVELFKCRAVVDGPGRIKLSDGRSLTARHILIATGATPNIDPKLPGREHVITSNEAFHLPEMPKRVLIAGAGYIAVEFAGIFHGLGAATTIVYRGDGLLRGFDEDLRTGLQQAYAARGIDIRLGHVFRRIDKTPLGLVAELDDGTKLEADQILFAIGRSPNTRGLGLEAAGVTLDAQGAVAVDELSQTNVPGIYAVGDVTNRMNLTPVAIREGHAFADTVFGGKLTKVDHTTVPTAVFSTPEIGTVGITEAAARAAALADGAGPDAVHIYKTSFRPMRNTLAGRDEKMLMKIIVNGKNDRVLGVHVLGPDAGEMAQVLAIAIRMGATKADFDATMALHPSAAEELVTLRTRWVG